MKNEVSGHNTNENMNFQYLFNLENSEDIVLF